MKFCTFRLQSPPDTVLHFYADCQCLGLFCSLLELHLPGKPSLSCWQSHYKHPRLGVTEDNVLAPTIPTMWKYHQNATITVSFKVVPQSQRDHLPLRYTSDTSGYITSLGFDHGVLYPTYLTSWREIKVPQGHGLMTSFPRFDLDLEYIGCLEVYLTDVDGNIIRVQHECSSVSVSAQVYSSLRAATVKMTSTKNDLGTGFKMLFSFHRPDRIPQKLSTGLFNCSVEHYASFRQHLDCNLETECEAGQDETGHCPYSSQHCQGHVASGDKCFFLVGTERLRDVQRSFGDQYVSVASFFHTVSWNEADDECRANGGRLASMSTSREWEDLLSFRQYSKMTITRLAVGLKHHSHGEPFMYRHMFRWTNRMVVYFFIKDVGNFIDFVSTKQCALVGGVFPSQQQMVIDMRACNDPQSTVLAVCEKPAQANHLTRRRSPHVISPSLSHATLSRACDSTRHAIVMACPCGHVTRDFLSCDLQSWCGEERYVDQCPILAPSHCTSRLLRWHPQHTGVRRDSGSVDANTTGTQFQPDSPCVSGKINTDEDSRASASVGMFVCNNHATLHFTLVCDFRRDCFDGSDESFCAHPPCEGFVCSNGQCVPASNRCDRVSNCLDDSDERGCQSQYRPDFLLHPPGLINLDGKGGFVASEYHESQPCPETHYRCPSEPRYCLPIYTRCNGYYDCIGKEDEHQCDDVRCPGLYRCRGSSVCVHVDHLCDGWPQCPQHDDEWLCQAKPCPPTCLCQGLSFVCNGTFPISDYPDLRYLNIEAVPGATLTTFNNSTYLMFLSLVGCDISSLPLDISLPNLLILDLSLNGITAVNMSFFLTLSNLKVLRLADNPITAVTFEESSTISLLQVIDLSSTLLQTFDSVVLSSYAEVKKLNLSHSNVHTIGEKGFQFLPALEVLDTWGCPLKHFQLDVFQGLTQLDVVYSSDYRLCCESVLPAQSRKPTCLTELDHLSTCENMLRYRPYHVILSLLSVVAVAGNAACMVVRHARYKESCLSSCGIWVSSTNAASMLMGVYTGTVAVADEVYRGRYVLHQSEWTESLTCRLACFLHLLSHQVSLFNSLVLSLDCFVALYFPCSKLRLNMFSASGVCLLTWTVGVVVAAVPVLPSTSAWQFNQQSALCFPMPAPVASFPGYNFHFGVVTLQTEVVSMLAIVCQGLNLLRLQQRGSSCLLRVSKDIVFAGQFFTISLVTALCWLVLGLYGLVKTSHAGLGATEFNVVLALVIGPFPAAFIPVALVWGKRHEEARRTTEAKLLARLRSRELDRGKRKPRQIEIKA